MTERKTGRELDPDPQDCTATDRLEGDAEEISAAVQARRFAIARAFDAAEAREVRAREDLPTAFIYPDKIAVVGNCGERIEAEAAANLEGWR